MEIAMAAVFDCEIQARLRDVNLGGHVDNVEAIRVVDEARVLFFRYAMLPGTGDSHPGLLGGLPITVSELVGAQRVDYHAEMRYAAYQPFLVRLWVSHVGRTSFSVSSEMRVAPGHEPALVAETSLVLWDQSLDCAWAITDALRAVMERYRDEPVALRRRPQG
ncbi:acyl-CoA thioesterase [Angustibacter luteus]|uniref:Acyl-CoA thioesterase n=1 Tax=Angustibacter luteus TaxID=658456 RepID=A0ABW1JF75_9ACTN